jgi:hypothetical protein
MCRILAHANYDTPNHSAPPATGANAKWRITFDFLISAKSVFIFTTT